jgi:hypothetical protein
MKGDFSRLKGDLSRHSFERLKHYAGVLHQQGRVWLDSDWNDEVLLQLNLLRQETFDIIGRCGAPKPGTAFTISPPQAGAPLDAFQIAGGPGPEGRYYVDGILCQLDKTVTYLTQPDFPNPPRLTFPPTGDLTALVYIEVWQRLITYLEDEEIREVALGGPDTATRIKTIAQVKVAPLPARAATRGDDGDITCDEALATLPVSGGTLTTLQPTDSLPPDPCRLPDPASYTGRENHLYRVEIHDGGDVTGSNQGFVFNIKLASNANAGAVNLPLVSALTKAEADALQRSGFVVITSDDGQLERARFSDISNGGKTIILARGLLNGFTTARNASVSGGVARFKWSRDNASFAVRVTAVSADRKTLTLASLGRDQVTTLREGDLVEIVDDVSELGPARGHLTNLTADPNPDTFTVTLADSLPPGFGVPVGGVTSPSTSVSSPPAAGGGRMILRRWDGQGIAQANFNETTTPQLNLGDGVHIRFGGSNLLPGDYWQFAARSIDGSIEVLNNAPPMGITRHRCALALVRWGLQTVLNINTIAALLANFPAVIAELQKTGKKEFDEEEVVQAAIRAGVPATGITSIRQILKSAAARGQRSFGMRVLEDCREPFRPLTDLPGPEDGLHVTQVSFAANGTPLQNDTDVQLEALMEGINILCDGNVDPESISRPTCFVTVETVVSQFTAAPLGTAYQTLVLGADVGVAGNTISWQPDRRIDPLLRQLVNSTPQGDRGVLTRLTLKGNFIWDRDNANRFLDGEAFGIQQPGSNNTSLRLPSGDGRRGGDFEMWFWLARPLGLNSLVVNPPTVIAGTPSQGTVTLSGPAPAGGLVVNLSSSATNRATVPPTVTIPAGGTSATFPIQTVQGQLGAVIIGANLAGVSLNATLNLVRLAGFVVVPPQIGPGQAATGTLTLSGPVPAAAVVSISSSNTQLVRAPANVTIPPNTAVFNFPIPTTPITGEISLTVSVSATLAGVTLAAPLVLIRIT